MIWITSGMRGPSRYWHRGDRLETVPDPLLGPAPSRAGGELRTQPSAVYANTVCGARIGGFAGVVICEYEVPPSVVEVEGAEDTRQLCLTCVSQDGSVE